MVQKNKKGQNKKPRIRKTPEYRSFRLSKKIKPIARDPLPGIIKLYRAAFMPLLQNKKLFLGIIGIYLLLTIVFVSGITSSTDFMDIKNNLEEVVGGSISGVTSTLTLFSYVVSTGGGGTDNDSSPYQIFIMLIVSLVIIWSIRQVMAGEKVGVRQAFYQGVYPLVPFVLILAVIGLQLIPFLIGNFLISIIFTNELAVSLLEKTLWWIIFILLALLSFYMIISSIFALYISTLPDMTPMKALRSARGLVIHRRLSVSLRLLGLPIVIILAYALVLIPLIIAFPSLVVPAFLLVSSFNLLFAHSYLYNLYRSLL